MFAKYNSLDFLFTYALDFLFTYAQQHLSQ